MIRALPLLLICLFAVDAFAESSGWRRAKNTADDVIYDGKDRTFYCGWPPAPIQECRRARLLTCRVLVAETWRHTRSGSSSSSSSSPGADFFDSEFDRLRSSEDGLDDVRGVAFVGQQNHPSMHRHGNSSGAAFLHRQPRLGVVKRLDQVHLFTRGRRHGRALRQPMTETASDTENLTVPSRQHFPSTSTQLHICKFMRNSVAIECDLRNR